MERMDLNKEISLSELENSLPAHGNEAAPDSATVTSELSHNNAMKEVSTTKIEIGSIDYFMIKLVKYTPETLYVVWRKKLSLDIARSVAANSRNTILVVQQIDCHEFDLAKEIGGYSEHPLYVGDEVQQELRCFIFGHELSSFLSSNSFTDFEEVDRQFTSFANSLQKQLIHIVEQPWDDLLSRKFKKMIIAFTKD